MDAAAVQGRRSVTTNRRIVVGPEVPRRFIVTMWDVPRKGTNLLLDQAVRRREVIRPMATDITARANEIVRMESRSIEPATDRARTEADLARAEYEFHLAIREGEDFQLGEDFPHGGGTVRVVHVCNVKEIVDLSDPEDVEADPQLALQFERRVYVTGVMGMTKEV